MEDNRLNPDQILKTIQETQSRSAQGKLRLFFGMAAGVGKTYAMLKAAHEQKTQGVDIVVALVETHGRKDTASLLEGLPLIPKQQISYRGSSFEELAIDAVIARRPQIVVVDELAHTNIPGSRHEKRYQDVLEILNAGINVYSTLNVQHLDSRADVVQLITAVAVRETVPDSVLDLVDRIELIDISPQDLIARLKEGKVYPGKKTDEALSYFFQEGNLSALREMSLRVTAEKVDRDLKGLNTQPVGIQQNKNKLVVAVSSSPYSERLIRFGRRLADDLEVDWVALHIDTGTTLSTEANNQLVQNLNLAEEMGAETQTLYGTNFVDVITDYVHKNDVIQLIVGRSLAKKNLAEKIIRNTLKTNVLVVQQPNDTPMDGVVQRQPKKFFYASIKSYLLSLAGVAIVTAMNCTLSPSLGYRVPGFVYLLLVIVLSLFCSFGPLLFTAVLSALIWDYCFIPPEGTMTIEAPEDAALLIVYFVVACACGYLTHRLKNNEMLLKKREETTRSLYEVLRAMTLVRGSKTIVELAIEKIRELLGGDVAVIIAQNNVLQTDTQSGSYHPTDKDRGVAAWSFQNGQMAGWSTSTLPDANVLCLCLKFADQKMGVLVYKPDHNQELTPDRQNLLFSIGNQISVALSREQYEEEIKKNDLLKESEVLHQTLLNSISHELRTPLTVIMGAATSLKKILELQGAHAGMLDEILSSSERLNHVFENLLDLARLESGSTKLKKEWCDYYEIVDDAANKHRKVLNGHKLVVERSTPVYGFVDCGLLEHAVSNILLNAANHTPKNGRIGVSIIKQKNETVINISDTGQGIPVEALPKLFDKFYRVPGTETAGLGLGLSIVKNILELHGGSVCAESRAGQGTTFALVLPYQEPPQHIRELS